MGATYADDWLTLYGGDCRAVLRELPAESVHCVVTSPPYWGLRDYGVTGQLGLESTPEEYVAAIVDVFREVRRVLRADGTLWLNLGDSYAGSGRGGNPEGSPWAGFVGSSGREKAAKASTPYLGLAQKQLVGIPWRVAFALQADGWYLRSDIIWSKPNPMPESVTDRPTKAHEYLFLLSKSALYFYDTDAVRERGTSGPSDLRKMTESRERIGGLTRKQTDPKLAASSLTNIGHKRAVGSPERNLRSVWTIATAPYPGAHFATFPPKLVEPCIKAGCPTDGVVLDPFAGTGTVGMVAQSLSRRAVLIDLNPDYLRQCLVRNAQTPLGLAQ